MLLTTPEVSNTVGRRKAETKAKGSDAFPRICSAFLGPLQPERRVEKRHRHTVTAPRMCVHPPVVEHAKDLTTCA